MEKKDLVCKMYGEGKSTLTIAKEVGISDWTVRTWLKQAGVTMRKRKVRKYDINDNFLDTFGEEQAYFIGYMLTDGSVSSRYRTISFRCSLNDKQLIEDLLKMLGSNYPIREYGNAITVEMRSEKLYEALSKYGITQNKTLDVRVPKIPKTLWIPFLRGVIDGDGSIGFYEYKSGSKYTIRITSGSKPFLEDIQNMVAELYNEYGSIRHTNGNCHVLTYQSKKFVIQFHSDLYKNAKISLKRKANLYESAWS